MNVRLCVMIAAVALAAMSCATCREKTATTPEEVGELLRAGVRMIEIGLYEDAYEAYADALDSYERLEAEHKPSVDPVLLETANQYRKLMAEISDQDFTRMLGLPFKLAEELRENPDSEIFTPAALRWYEHHAAWSSLFDESGVADCPYPSFHRRQKEYSYVLDMALTKCEYDAAKIRGQYPNIAQAWWPLLAADLDGNGMNEFVVVGPDIGDHSVLNVFFPRKGGGFDCFSFENAPASPSVSVSDADSDGRDEILLRQTLWPERGRVVTPRDSRKEWLQWDETTITLKLEDGKFVKADETFRAWESPPRDW